MARLNAGPFDLWLGVLYSAPQRLKTSEPLVPPKPKEFERA